jgi:hypothetical protein
MSFSDLGVGMGVGVWWWEWGVWGGRHVDSNMGCFFRLFYAYEVPTENKNNFKNVSELMCIKCKSLMRYRCEAWSLTLREESRLRVFDNRVLRRVFGPKRDEVTVEWRKLHNEELNDLYSLPNIVRVVKSR